ncbi:hypothetical protein H113_08970 [Trichophyton rubrum MR1459]|uniref:Uncharacterized protein n=1 Tax=Trichophyton rubrum CBS 288.86 TaxID=1215330 RepID=A0A022VMR0_TRIRU|nr:hypothetical protein H100_08922 [Trichophyton rubrum MR850]EZF47261.1 hypothetical protein H103_08904 [Trichophyton rubrum CBS 288.86]EZF57918.1 hypothetical protein H104_08853 [Trichophyton rubrum CBS 289.86]EZF89891.1 hypothetical protein H113_08970 [Trichophyton rubrum MR1459]EZG11414.1 hypothetical protein H107_09060 [Trichophyton rubrum CBS 202.88]
MAPPRRTRRLTPSAAAGASNEADNPYLPSIETQQTFSPTQWTSWPMQLTGRASAGTRSAIC